jgi:hypothetical protein
VAIHDFLHSQRKDVDARDKPGHDKKEAVGWAKAQLRRAHQQMSGFVMMGTLRFAHPTKLDCFASLAMTSETKVRSRDGR